LKAGLWVRRARLAIVAPDPRHSRRSQADFPLIGLSEFGQPPLSVIRPGGWTCDLDSETVEIRQRNSAVGQRHDRRSGSVWLRTRRGKGPCDNAKTITRQRI
jgi:hypothetical protein